MLCHRCGENLGTTDLFCPYCGSPQVKFNPPEDEVPLAAASSSSRFPTGVHGICWPEAIRVALLVGIPAGILSGLSILSWGCCLWIGGGAALAIALYQKRAPQSPRLSTRSGMNVGAMAGLMAAYASVSTTAVSRVVERFALHRGAEIDSFYDMVIRQSSTLIHSNPAAEAQWQKYVHFLLTPDGRAAYMLLNSVTTSIGIIAISALGGALGVRLFSGKKQL